MASLAIALAGSWACDDEATQAVDAGVSEPDMMRPPFNYIPLNDEACEVEAATPGVQQIAAEALQALVERGDHHIAGGLKLCNEQPIVGCDFTCTGEDNPLLQLGRDFAGPLSEYVAGVSNFDISDGLEAYFQDALAWPYRELVVSYVACDALPPGACPPSADVQVVLTQGRQQRCGGSTDGCDVYSIEPESLDLQCSRFPMALHAAVNGDLGGAYDLTATLPPQAEEDGVYFGFVVPLVGDYPDAGATLSEEALISWLDRLDRAQQSLEVKLRDFALDIAVADDGTVCGRMQGRLSTQTFVDALQIEDPSLAQVIDNLFSQYADPDAPDLITGQFTFALEPGRFVSGMPCHPDPCVTTESMCLEGEVLSSMTTRDRCWLDAGAGVASGDVLEPSCAPRAENRIVEWSIDCAALGSACSVDLGCGVDYVTPGAGDLVFTELFVGDGVQESHRDGPNTIDDQWVELYNASDAVLDLDGCIFRSGPSAYGPASALAPSGPVPVAPGERIVLAHDRELDRSGLSSIAYHYGWPVGMGQAEGDDRIAIYCGPDGETLVDEVRWADGWGINDDAASMRLDDGVLDAAGNDDLGAWCVSDGDVFTEGRVGTPGAPNGACP